MSEHNNSITQDRARTNILRGLEQPVLLWLCKNIPDWLTPNILTGIGLMGSAGVALSIYAAKWNRYYLLLSILAFAVQWFGDSLDGRIAYFRGQPRKWYGMSLDMVMDWLSTIFIGLGFYYYLSDEWKVFAYLFVTLYAWTMLLAMMKYRITDNYAIDAGLFGPTELRVSLCVVMLLEVLFAGSLLACAITVCAVLVIINFVDFARVLKLGNERDQRENEQRNKQA